MNILFHFRHLSCCCNTVNTKFASAAAWTYYWIPTVYYGSTPSLHMLFITTVIRLYFLSTHSFPAD